MNSIMIAFGWASAALVVGVILRAKVKFLQNMLVPASVIAGIIGLAFMNGTDFAGINVGATADDFTNIVNSLFVVSFISITLMEPDAKEKESSGQKGVLKGALAIGLIWCILFTVTPLLGGLISKGIGKSFDMAPIYGMLIQFAFCMGPGQSVTYGKIVEGYGWNNAVMVGLTFSAIGFLVAYLVGIPAARYGIRKGYAKYSDKIDEKVLRGYLKEEEQTQMMKKETTINSTIESMAFHFAIIGIDCLIAIVFSKLFALLPGYIGTSLSSLMFLNGMYAAYLTKFVMKKLHIWYFIDNDMQSKITGWSADYLVVCSFMAVALKLVSQWLVPIVVISVVGTIVTFVLCVYFGQRVGSTCDFEKFLGLYGMACGTAPTGISLIRIADPGFKTTACVELGASNPVCNICNIPTYLLILGFAAGQFSFRTTIIGLAGLIVALLIGYKISGCWGKKVTFTMWGQKMKNGPSGVPVED